MDREVGGGIGRKMRAEALVEDWKVRASFQDCKAKKIIWFQKPLLVPLSTEHFFFHAKYSAFSTFCKNIVLPPLLKVWRGFNSTYVPSRLQ